LKEASDEDYMEVVERTLGLKFVSQVAGVDVYVTEQIEEPDAN
jgi:hypothetical protein